MSFSEVSLLFLVQMACGSLITFVVNDRAALGPKYYKFGGWVLLGLYGLALSLRAGDLLDAQAGGVERLLAAGLLLCALGLLAFCSVTGWDKPRVESALLWGTLLAGVGVVAAAGLVVMPADLDRTETALTLAGGLGSALVLGFCTWGMILGHWYLVAQGLAIGHLRRLVAPLPWLLLAKAALSGLALLLMWERVLDGQRSLGDILERQPERVLDVVNVWARIPVGLLVPAVMAFMTRVTVRMEKTQPATGILYAMCTAVYLGDLIGKMVEGSTGVPL